MKKERLPRKVKKRVRKIRIKLNQIIERLDKNINNRTTACR